MLPDPQNKQEGAQAPSLLKAHRRREGFGPGAYLIFACVLFAALILCICIGSVRIPVQDTVSVIWAAVFKKPLPAVSARSIILSVRLPRVLCVALVGAALSICGAAMQGLLKNPLADGSTLGVSSGASLGAALAIAFGVTLPGFPSAGPTAMAMAFAFGSLLLILALAYRLDYSLSTSTIILIGVIFSMFINSVLSIVITFSGEKLRHITFWTMGSLSGSSYSWV